MTQICGQHMCTVVLCSFWNKCYTLLAIPDGKWISISSVAAEKLSHLISRFSSALEDNPPSGPQDMLRWEEWLTAVGELRAPQFN